VCQDYAAKDACNVITTCVAALDMISIHLQFAVFGFSSDAQVQQFCG